MQVHSESVKQVKRSSKGSSKILVYELRSQNYIIFVAVNQHFKSAAAVNAEFI